VGACELLPLSEKKDVLFKAFQISEGGVRTCHTSKVHSPNIFFCGYNRSSLAGISVNSCRCSVYLVSTRSVLIFIACTWSFTYFGFSSL